MVTITLHGLFISKNFLAYYRTAELAIINNYNPKYHMVAAGGSSTSTEALNPLASSFSTWLN